MTKLYKYILLIFLITTSCNENQFPEKDKNGTRIFYNLDKYVAFKIKHKNQKVIIIDTFCTNEKKRAIGDIERNKLTYFETLGFEKKEFDEILLKYNIKRESLEPHGGSRWGKFNVSCYAHEMNDELERKYGATFFDSIRTIARKIYISKHQNEVYIEGGRDIREAYK